MKKKILFSLAFLIFASSLIGCSKIEEKQADATNGDITITCTDEKDNSTGIEIQNVTTYHFDEEQYVTDYSIETTQKFKDKSTYKEYKKAQEETSSDTSSEDISYDLKSDDKKLILVFTMTIKDINIDDAETEEEKDSLKASTILKRKEEANSTCRLDGIDRSELD